MKYLFKKFGLIFVFILGLTLFSQSLHLYNEQGIDPDYSNRIVKLY